MDRLRSSAVKFAKLFTTLQTIRKKAYSSLRNGHNQWITTVSKQNWTLKLHPYFLPSQKYRSEWREFHSKCRESCWVVHWLPVKFMVEYKLATLTFTVLMICFHHTSHLFLLYHKTPIFFHVHQYCPLWNYKITKVHKSIKTYIIESQNTSALAGQNGDWTTHL